MKKATSLIVFFLLFSIVLFSQDVIRLQPCNNVFMEKQADSIKQVVTKEGFSLLKESSITMETQYEMPIVVPLQKGSLYHFVFIGEPGSKLYEVRMFDWAENQVLLDNKTAKEGNIVAFSHVPEATELHSFRVLQANKQKKKGLCGYVMLFKKTKA